MTADRTAPRTLVEKIWDDHVVVEGKGAPSVLAIDLHLVHEVTSPQAFTGLRRRGLKVAHPERTVATADHSVPTTPRNLPILDPMAAAQVDQLTTNCTEFGIPLHGLGSPSQGIVHVIGPQLGLTQPGMTIVCGDSHTSTHGAFGALAFGIGTSEVEMVLATQCLLQRRPKTYEVRVDGRLAPGVSAKDVILNLLSRIGVGGGTGHVFEYRGPAIEALSMDQRMTICNMSIEGGARAGLIAPDDTTFAYLAGRAHAPQGAEWDAAVERWRSLPSDAGAEFDRTISIDASALEPMITYGTNPGMGLPISARVPDPDASEDGAGRRALEQALAYMDLQPGQPILGQKIDVVFIGSCTNGRISDLRLAAAALEGRTIADGVRLMVVPGSDEVKREAEREGLHEIFRAAGADWREAGCSMCIAMNGDQLTPGQYAVSTSNRNFEGRQGKGGRTFLASPLTAAASAVAGVIADPRLLPGIESLAAVGGEVAMADPYASFSSRVIPLPAENVDTDQIVPARFLKVTDKEGLGEALFRDWRFESDGSLKSPAFVLDQPEMAGRQILLAGDNFGCGSSREHAPWALAAWGIRAVITSSCADIFRGNSLKNGLLPIIVSHETQRQLFELLEREPDAELRVDLESQVVHLPGDEDLPFDVDPFSKLMLLKGTDELGYLLGKRDDIEGWESSHPARVDTRSGAGT